MIICPNCKNQLERPERICPYCGQKFFTPEEAKETLKVTDELLATPDLSFEGLNITKEYLEHVSRYLLLYKNLINSIAERHLAAKNNNKLFQDRKWRSETRILLRNILVISMCNIENPNYSIKIIHNPPKGCQLINLLLGIMSEETGNLYNNYEKFLNGTDSDALSKVYIANKNIIANYNKVWEGINKVADLYRKEAQQLHNNQ